MTASGVDISVGMLIPDLKVARIVCNQLTADVNLSPPDAKGVFGTLTASLEGNVLLSIPSIPGSPIPGYYYQGQKLRIEFTLVEPVYTVTVTPGTLSIPQGCDNGPTPTTVTVTPLEASITSYVNLGFECNMWGINGQVQGGGGTPPLTSLPLQITVQSMVPKGTYTANVVANDPSTGKQFRSNNINITVTESGYTITVDGQNSPANLGSITQGSGKNFKIDITPWTSYSNGMPLAWNPTNDFSGIGISIPGGVPPPPCEVTMSINVSPGASIGTHEMDIMVTDGTLGNRQFTCHVTFEVVAP